MTKQQLLISNDSNPLMDHNLQLSTPTQQILFSSLPQASFPPLLQNCNPFVLKFVTGNIRICQSCRSSLRQMNGTIYCQPYNLCVSRLERMPYWHNGSKSWCTPVKESNAHYCANLSSLQASNPSFVGRSLLIPSEIAQKLSPIHMNCLTSKFLLVF